GGAPAGRGVDGGPARDAPARGLRSTRADQSGRAGRRLGVAGGVGHGGHERLVVRLVLIGIGGREGGDGTVEAVSGAEVAGDRRRIAGARVSQGQRVPARTAVLRQL